MESSPSIGLLLFPGLMQLDLTGPAEVFGALPGARVHLVWKSLDPVATSRGWKIVPTTTLADCPDLDVICVPGGGGQIDLMDDDEVLAFLGAKAKTARWVTSVCTGSLVLGAAGLLQGYRAACHWASREQLALFGAIPVAERVVRDRNRITGGGVTSGIDFALAVAVEIAGEEVAKMIQLNLEYDPHPPFDCGSPQRAGADLVARFEKAGAERQQRRWEATRRAAAKLGVDV